MVRQCRDHRLRECEHGIPVHYRNHDQRTRFSPFELDLFCPVPVSWHASATSWAQIGAVLLLAAAAREWTLTERQAKAVQSLTQMYLAITASFPRNASSPLRLTRKIRWRAKSKSAPVTAPISRSMKTSRSIATRRNFVSSGLNRPPTALPNCAGSRSQKHGS